MNISVPQDENTFKNRSLSAAERRHDRMEKHATRLLREVLRRTRFTATDRDMIASFLEGVVSEEMLYRSSAKADRT